MWKIKDKDLREKLSSLVTDDEINRECIKQMNDEYEAVYIPGLSSRGFALSIKKSNLVEVPDYDPNEWNPYPDVTPPENGLYLVTISFESQLSVMIFHWDHSLDPAKWWKYVIAFRACPPAYKPAKQTDTCL